MKRISGVIFILFILFGCAPSQQEVALNNARMTTFQALNTQRTYEPVTISGITKIEGKITIKTLAVLDVVQAPGIQYDTSDTDLWAKGIDGITTLGAVGLGVWGAKVIGDAMQPQVIQQAEPVIIEPFIVDPVVIPSQ